MGRNVQTVIGIIAVRRVGAAYVRTVWLYLNGARPALLGWSDRYGHLREVTREDVLTHLKTLHGHHRRDQLGALRSLFTWAKRSGLIFRNPTSRI